MLLLDLVGELLDFRLVSFNRIFEVFDGFILEFLHLCLVLDPHRLIISLKLLDLVLEKLTCVLKIIDFQVMHLELENLDVLSEILDGVVLPTALTVVLPNPLREFVNLRFLRFQKPFEISNLFLLLTLDGFDYVLLELLEMLSKLTKVFIEVARHGVEDGVDFLGESGSKRCFEVLLEHGEESFHVPLVLVVLRHQSRLQVHCGLHREFNLVSRFLFFLFDQSILRHNFEDCLVHVEEANGSFVLNIFDIQHPIILELDEIHDLGLVVVQECIVFLDLRPGNGLPL